MADGGPAPYGYQKRWGWHGPVLVPDDDEQAVIARIVRMRTERVSLRAIAAALDKDGVERAQRRSWVDDLPGRKPRKGWSAQSVLNVLRRASNVDTARSLTDLTTVAQAQHD